MYDTMISVGFLKCGVLVSWKSLLGEILAIMKKIRTKINGMLTGGPS